ncbi:MAG: RNA polymerase sigma factor RpoD/SigA [Fibrobacter sp.]|nr:RNA polymerase sigma factor RpoD/SigA [Fibrobacter sp.]
MKRKTDWNENTIYYHYLNEIAAYPLLSRDEERALLSQVTKGNEAALNRLVRSNLRFVINVANMYKNQGLSLGELINEGNLGLIEAAHRFDPTRNIKFISYAVWWIRQSITRAISEKARIVRISAEKELVLRRLNRASGRLKQVVGGTYVPDTDYLEGVSKYKGKQIEEVLQMGHRSTSLDAPLTDDTEGTLIDVLPSEGDTPEEALIKTDTQSTIEQMVSKLDPQEQEVVTYYYGLKSDYSLNLKQIGTNIGLSKERVRQIKENALRKLRELPEIESAA